MANSGSALVGQLKTGLWHLAQAAKAQLPTWTRYVESTSIRSLKESWPPLKTVDGAPFIYRPTPAQQEWIRRTRYYGEGPLVLPPVVVHQIRRGILFPQTGTIATPRGQIIVESCKDGGLKGATPTYNRMRWPRPRSMGNTAISTIEVGSYRNSHGHWILDALPRLWALSKLDFEVQLLVRSDLGNAKRQLLLWAKPENVTVVEVDDEVPVTSERVLLTPYVTIGGCGLMRPEIVDYLRTRIVRGALAARSSEKMTPPRFYVSRERTTYSRVANEEELKSALRKEGIESVILEDLPVEEQVAHFANAELVVGALSSGLTNCLFQTKGALVEIFAGGETNDSHTPSITEAGMCMVSGIRYEPVYHHHPSPEPAFTADVAKVLAAISRVDA